MLAILAKKPQKPKNNDLVNITTLCLFIKKKCKCKPCLKWIQQVYNSVLFCFFLTLTHYVAKSI